MISSTDMDGEISCLNLAMNKLAESQKRDQSVGNGRYQYGKARYLSGITCFWCHKKGLLQENRPLAKKAGKITVNKEINGSEPSTDWRYKRPEKKNPETKVVNDTTYNFCNKFGLRNLDGSQQYSDDNKKKEEISKLEHYSRNVAATHYENPTYGGILHLVASLFLGSVQKPPGSEVMDARYSTSYSGVEYSWAPKLKRYREDAFICQSVWSDNEYAVFLSNKPHDGMDLDALADNIILSKFPGENEELLGENEFLDLNEGPDPDVGLKFQERQA